MAERDSPTIKVGFIRIETQFPDTEPRLRREGFVELDHTDICHLEAALCKCLGDRIRRTYSHDVRIDSHIGIRYDSCHRLQTQFFDSRARHKHQCRGGVIDSRGVARGHGPVFSKCRPQGSEALCRGIRRRMLVGIENFDAFARLYLYRNDLLLELSLLDSRHRLLLAEQRVGVLILTRAAKALGDVLRRHSHDQAIVGICEDIGKAVLEFASPHAPSPAHVIAVVRYCAHVLDATRYSDGRIAQTNGAGYVDQGLHARSATTDDTTTR